MALTAAVATAVAAICAAVAVGLSPVLFGATLVPAIMLVARGRQLRLPRLPPGQQPAPGSGTQPGGFDVRLLAGLTGAGALIYYLTGQGHSAGSLATVARVALLAVVPLSLFWPAPVVLRYCLLLSAGAMVGAGPSLATGGWPVLGLAAGAAVALVAANRLSAVSMPTLTPSPVSSEVRRRRVVGDAAVLLAIAGLAGLLAAALLPPPGTGNRPQPGGRPSSGSRQATPAPYLQPTDRLDPGGRGSGKGNQVVLRVSAPGPALWRTQTFGSWDGRFWGASPDAGSPVDPNPRSQSGRFAFVPRGVGEDGQFDAQRFDQRITVEASSIGVLAAASRATTVQLPGGRLRVASDGTMVPSPFLGKGTTYVVTSFLPPSDEGVLRGHDALSAGVPPDVARLYLGFPALPSRVPALAAELTAAAPTSYDKVRALETWLITNTEVVANTPPLPAGADPIDQFLLVNRRGSSEQAATAMAVMLRSLGIPTRLAVGYLPGQRSALGGELVVRARDAHAWVEVWFPDVGWVAFDPAGRFAASSSSNESFLSRLRRLLGALWWLLVVVAGAALIWLAGRAVAWWWQRRSRPWATRCYERITRAGRAGGHPRQPDETPAEYCGALAGELPDGRLVRVGELLSVAAYSSREPPADAQSWADGVVRDLERSSGRRRRRVGARPGLPG